jgi:hypothetical protein
VGKWRLALLLALPAAGCGIGGGMNCTDLYAYGLTISVKDPAGVAICDATVVAVDGAYRETLMALGGGSCSYVGAGERAGQYAVTASKTGLKSASVEVTVTRDACHVKGEQRTLVLAP